MTRVMIQRVNGNVCSNVTSSLYFLLLVIIIFVTFIPSIFIFFSEVPKLKRKAPLGKKEKKDKEKAPKKEKEVAEIKVEGSENVDNVEDELKVEEETLEDPEGPRK